MSDPRHFIETRIAPPLGCDEVHVWHVNIGSVSPQAWSVLSTDEQARAERYRFARDRERFVSCRAKLRQTLGQYLVELPERLVFDYGPHGKPMLARPESADSIAFNVSHSGDHALFAFARERAVGVDVECATRKADFQNLADHFLSVSEARHIREAIETSRAFHSCWTRKEAWMKALGCGLSEPLSRFDTSSTLGQITGVVACEDFSGLKWSLSELTPAPDLLGAVAVEGTGMILKYLRDPS